DTAVDKLALEVRPLGAGRYVPQSEGIFLLTAGHQRLAVQRELYAIDLARVALQASDYFPGQRVPKVDVPVVVVPVAAGGRHQPRVRREGDGVDLSVMSRACGQ